MQIGPKRDSRDEKLRLRAKGFCIDGDTWRNREFPRVKADLRSRCGSHADYGLVAGSIVG